MIFLVKCKTLNRHFTVYYTNIYLSSVLEQLLGKKKEYIYMSVSGFLGFCPDPKHFIVNCQQIVVKFAEKWRKMY